MTESEARIQAEIFQWHWNTMPEERGLLFEVNNNPTSAADGARRKSIGMVSGVSDMIYLSPSGVICIEVKTDNGKQSKNQVWWQSVVESYGIRYEIVRNLCDFKKLL